jgi:hypothetical protein
MIGLKGPARAPKHEDAITSIRNAPQVFKPCVCSDRGFSCNCDSQECAYVPGCIVWQRSSHCLVR